MDYGYSLTQGPAYRDEFGFYLILNTLVSSITSKPALEGLNMLLRTSAENVRRWMETKTDQPDTMSCILAHNVVIPSQPLCEEEIVANSMALIIVRSDTISTPLVATVHNLLQRPGKLQILGNEIRSSLMSEVEING